MKVKQTYIWMKEVDGDNVSVIITRLNISCTTPVSDDKHYVHVAADIAVDEVQRLRVNELAIPEGNGVEGDDYTVTVQWEGSE